ncbi:MAG: class I SAM-dependent methyltransferase [Anaerolineae bacterium]
MTEDQDRAIPERPQTGRPICNYEGSRYSTEFWTQARTYEDAAERIALQALLPPCGQTLMEIGAGFGRLVELYQGYETVVLMDYAHTQLAQAVERLGSGGTEGRPHYVFVQANFYHLPFVPGRFDTITMIRTLHHAADAPTVLRNVSESLEPAGAFVLEFANKHNLKAIARYLLGRQRWSPFSHEPIEFVDLNFDFHPRWIWKQLNEAGLHRERVRTVSHFRIPLLKRWMPTRVLVALDRLAQPTGRLWQLSPSVFVRARADANKPAAAPDAFFCCPACRRPLGSPPQARFVCECGAVWEKKDQIYDFRYPRD